MNLLKRKKAVAIMINERIIQLRDEQGLTQKQLAEKLDINVSVMNRIEQADRPIRDNEILKIANFFNVSTDYLLGRTNVKRPIETVAAHRSDDFRTRLPAEDVEKINEIIEFYLEKNRKNT